MKDQFIAVLQEALELEDQEVQLGDAFRDYDEWDSLAQLSLIALIDENFEVTIEDSEFETLETVEDLLNAVMAKKA